MKRMTSLALGDFKNITRDPILLLLLLSPFLLIVSIQFGLPWVEELTLSQFSFDLSIHHLFIKSFILLLTPLVIGVIVGFMLLEDRDEGVLIYYAVTPLTLVGYLIFKLASPVIISFIASFIIIAYLGASELNLFQMVPVIFMAALGALMITLIMVTFANNKVEGLAITKVTNLFLIAPIVGYIIESKWQLLLGISPPYWVSKAFMAGVEGSDNYLYYLAAGFIFHLVCIVVLLKRFNQKVL